MGRSVSYPSAAQVVTFATIQPVDCWECEGRKVDDEGDTCTVCNGEGVVEEDDTEYLIYLFREDLKHLFPSVEPADDWIDREDHVLAENRLARFGMSEYCGLVAYWIVPKARGYYSSDSKPPLATKWIASIADKFVAAFGELSKVGSMSNGEGVYRRIDK